MTDGDRLDHRRSVWLTLAEVRKDLVAYASRELSQSALNWPLIVRLTIGIGVGTLAGVGAVQVFAFMTGVHWFEWLVVASTVLLASCAIYLLARLYWMISLGRNGTQPYVLAVLASAAALTVCTEAFAGVTLMLWKSGAVSAARSARPDIWSAQLLYLWHLADAVPLLSVPTTLGLASPRVFTNLLAGALLLAFRLLVLVPLIHIALSGYQLSVRRWSDTSELDRAIGARRRAKREPSVLDTFWDRCIILSREAAAWIDDAPWRAPAFFVLSLATIAVVAGVLANPAFVLHSWLVGETRSPLHVWVVSVSLHWVRVVPDWFGVALLVPCIAVGALVVLSASSHLWDTSAIRVSRVGLICVGFLILVWGFCAIVSAALVTTGLASFHPAVSARSGLSSALAASIWHVIDGIPGLEIPETLHWSLHHDLRGVATGIVELGFKVAVVVILALPIARIAAAYSAEHRSGPRTPPVMAARTLYEKLVPLLDDALRPWDLTVVPTLRRQPDHPTFGVNDFEIADVKAAYAAVETLFGDSEPTRAARAAASRTVERGLLRNAAFENLPDPPTPEDMRSAATSARDATQTFVDAANTAFRDAMLLDDRHKTPDRGFG